MSESGKVDPKITDIPGLFIGHAEDKDALTGCTVVLVPSGATAGVDVRGSAPGTRETDLLEPTNLVDKVHAILLAGGSAFGLDAATGVMRWLEEHHCGFDTGAALVPIVPGAVLFDLAIGRADRRPDAGMGYTACENAGSSGGAPSACPPVASPAQGNVGAGTGATVGKLFGPAMATKSGLGTDCLTGPGGLLVGAVVAVNAFGDVRDPRTGAILAGTRNPAGGWLDTAAALAGLAPGGAEAEGLGVGGGASGPFAGLGQNTTIGVAATNALLTKAQAKKVAQMAHDGLARTINPVHTMYDGDTLFALSCSNPAAPVQADVSLIGVLAAEAVARAVVRAVVAAERAGGLPAARDLRGGAHHV